MSVLQKFGERIAKSITLNFNENVGYKDDMGDVMYAVHDYSPDEPTLVFHFRLAPNRDYVIPKHAMDMFTRIPDLLLERIKRLLDSSSYDFSCRYSAECDESVSCRVDLKLDPDVFAGLNSTGIAGLISGQE